MLAAPSSVLFACTSNALRSPMAEAIAKHLFGHVVYVDSVGIRAGELDGFAVAAMDEIGIDLSAHKPKTFDDLEDAFFDLVVSLSPEAQHRAVEMTRTMACELEFWNTFDPSIAKGSRETMLDAYRGVRDGLMGRITGRFEAAPTPSV
jgi:protein-tyrosine-phosphatase